MEIEELLEYGEKINRYLDKLPDLRSGKIGPIKNRFESFDYSDFISWRERVKDFIIEKDPGRLNEIFWWFQKFESSFSIAFFEGIITILTSYLDSPIRSDENCIIQTLERRMENKSTQHSLKGLIDEGYAIKDSIRVHVYRDDEKIRRIDGPKHDIDTVKYEKWKNVVRRFVLNNYKGDYAQEEIEAAFKSFDDKESLKNPADFQVILGLLEGLLEYPSEADSTKEDARKIKFSNKKVFIVHGHNNELVAETKAFLLQLGLEPIVLRDQVNKGQTIIEKIESYSDVAFAIVLYTKCDKGGLNKENSELKPRARQNVVFEHGYLCSKLERENVLPLLEEGVAFPGDLSGIVYTVIDKADAWKTKAAKEMKAAGLNVDLNSL